MQRSREVKRKDAMTIMRKFFGPESKYDQSLPFAYYAKVSPVEDDDNFLEHYFADTICGLIRYLESKEIPSETTRLFGAYSQHKDKEINSQSCINQDGQWLSEREICKSFEDLYKATKKDCYKGCVAIGKCSFDDRNRYIGGGPY